MSMLRAAMTISGLTLVSRITGLIRDVLIAKAFGAGGLTDAFWVAFRIPNLLRRLFAEGAFSQAFVPILGEIKNNKSPDEVKTFIDRIAVVLVLVLMITAIAGVLTAPWVVSLMGSGMRQRPDSFIAAVWMTQVMFPYIVCMSLVALASGVLNTWKKFAIPAFTPVLLNLSMIFASLFLVNFFVPPVYALAIGVMLGGVLQLSIQVPALYRLGLLPKLSLNLKAAWQDPEVKRVLKQMLPAILGVSVAQISLIINTNIATWLTPGSVTWLSFADRLMEFPTALLGIALGTVLLPSLSQANAKGLTSQYSALLDWGLRLILLLGLPAALGMGVLSEGLVAVLFNYGKFGASDVAQTQLAVMSYSVGLIGLLAIKILAPGFYAKQDIRTPVKIALFVLAATQVMNLIFVPWLSHAGLALSVGMGACLNAFILLISLRKHKIYQAQAGWLLFLAKLVLSVCVMALSLYWLNSWVDWLALRSTPVMRVAYLLILIFVAVAVYFISLGLLGFRPRHFRRAPSLDS